MYVFDMSSDDGRDSTKFYTDPQFFFNLWMQSMIQFPSNHHPHAHAHRSGGKQERYRSPVYIEKDMQRERNMSTFCFR
jgi:hypothetical protein